ncbi:hypothetical protein Bbelb_122900 [Branchiostoma belcheri]|nr:hypothetical protein Bbelb_122900 [Branchiostoma belcheri]
MDVSTSDAIQQFHQYLRVAPPCDMFVPHAHYHLTALYSEQQPVDREKVETHYRRGQEAEKNRLPGFLVPEWIGDEAKKAYNRATTCNISTSRGTETLPEVNNNKPRSHVTVVTCSTTPHNNPPTCDPFTRGQLTAKLPLNGGDNSLCVGDIRPQTAGTPRGPDRDVISTCRLISMETVHSIRSSVNDRSREGEREENSVKGSFVIMLRP